MPRLLHAVLCRDAVVDRETNMVSLQGLIEEMRLPGAAFRGDGSPPNFAMGPLVLFATFSWDWPVLEPRSSLVIKLQLRTPKGHTHSLAAIQAPQDPTPRFRTIFRMPGFLFDAEGVYVFEVVAGDVVASQVPMVLLALPESVTPAWQPAA